MFNPSYFPNVGCMFNSALCSFDSSLSGASMLITLIAVIGVVLSYLLLKNQTKQPGKKLLIMALGVIIFELFTAPMWNSYHLGRFSYFYNDLSLTLTLGWIAIFQLSIILVDKLFKKSSEIVRFFYYLVPITFATFLAETLLVAMNIRTYAPEVLETSIGNAGVIPVELFYYAPVFGTLVLSFYFAWTKTGSTKLSQAFTKQKLGVTAGLLAIAIGLYELLIEPLVHTPGFPAWSYFYQDISFVRIALWVGMIIAGMWLGSLLLVGKKKVSDLTSFFAYLAGSTIVFYIVEVMMLTGRSRIYTESVTTNFTGVFIPVLQTPVEVLLAIVLYLTLIISFLKYWSSVLESR